jgi:beta-lactamase superfamily II metal-dependent hydrolase
MLIDAGNATPVMKQLSKMKVNRLNIVVATKDSPDAIAGLGDILDSNDVDEFWYSGITPRTQQLKDAITRIKAREIPIKHPHRGDTASIAGIDFYALNPEKQFYNGAPEADAVVLKISSGNFCMLLLNPTNQEKENAFIGLNESMDCQVATYFNHGEGRAQASLFIKDYVKPDDVIISAGNTDGLPSSTILTYMSIYGIDTWVTGTNGTIEVIGDTSGTYSISASKNSTG